jgi:hypothetical protein
LHVLKAQMTMKSHGRVGPREIKLHTSQSQKCGFFEVLFFFWTFSVVCCMNTMLCLGSCLCFHPQVQTYLVDPLEITYLNH